MTLASRPPLTAAQLCQAQAKLGLSNQELADALEITGKGGPSTISLYRKGHRPLPMRASQLIRIWLDARVPEELKPRAGGAS